jgi:hypothetical protein
LGEISGLFSNIENDNDVFKTEEEQEEEEKLGMAINIGQKLVDEDIPSYAQIREAITWGT